MVGVDLRLGESYAGPYGAVEGGSLRLFGLDYQADAAENPPAHIYCRSLGV